MILGGFYLEFKFQSIYRSRIFICGTYVKITIKNGYFNMVKV